MENVITSEVILIPAHTVSYVEDKLAALAKRAKRSGKPVPVFAVVGHTTTQRYVGDNLMGEPVYQEVPWAQVTVTGERPVLGGWQVIANLVKVGEANVIRAVAGHTGDLELYRHATNVCDHCGTKRQRNETWLFRNEDGETKQVARNCCQDFIGATDIDLARMASWADFVGWVQDPDTWNGASHHNMVDYLAATAALVRLDGWTPKSRATTDKPATAEHVERVILAQADPQALLPLGSYPKITADDYQAAQAALAWIRSDGLDTSNGYIANARVACSVDWVVPKTGALVASVVGAAYPNMLKRQVEATPEAVAGVKTPSAYVGAVGDRITFDAKLVRWRQWEGDYGLTTLMVFEDDAGNMLQWYASGDHHRTEGARFSVKGTVKRHQVDRYTGAKATTLTRCVVKGA